MPILLLLLLTTGQHAAYAITDTLRSQAGNSLIVSYNIKRNGSEVSIEFVNARKLLGNRHKRKYGDDLTKVVPVFFDGGGNHGVEFTGDATRRFQVPPSVRYRSSQDGFYLLHESDMPTLTFDMGQTPSTTVSIPIYLAIHETTLKLLKFKKEGSYKVFDQLGDLNIPLRQTSASGTNGGDDHGGKNGRKIVGYREEVDYEQEVVDGGGGQSYIEGGGALDDALPGLGGASGLSPDEEAKILMERIEQLMPMETGNTLSENIMGSISQLNALSSKITDPELRAKANQTLNSSYSQKAKLEQAAQAREQAKNDSIVAEQKAEAEKSEKRSLWMIIGGIALAILAFAGNQVLQHFRGLRNLRNMENLQENVMRKAENEARQRTQAAIRKQTQRLATSVEEKMTRGAKKDHTQPAASPTATPPGTPGNKTIQIGGKTYQVKTQKKIDKPQSTNNDKDIKI